MEKGYWIAVGAKPLHVVDQTFCSIPTDSANYRHLDCLTFEALVAQCKLAKQGGSGSSVSASSSMIKSAKTVEKRNKGVCTIGGAYLSLVGSLYFILEFLLYYRKDNLVILVIRSLFLYQGLVLPY